jgi:hypothetical protein
MRLRPTPALAVTLLLAALPALAQQAPPAAPPAAPAATGGDAEASRLAQQLSNPVASLVSVPFQSNWDFGVGPEEKQRYLLNFQPVMPFSLNDDWNLIARVIVPVISQPPLVPGGQPTFGIGDFVTSFFLSPAKPSAFIWGVGPALLVPATSDPFLGTGRWGAGPTGVVLVQSGPLTYGALANHLWSYGGDSTREEVNQTFVQPFLSYGTSNGYTFTLQAEASGNWEAPEGERWTVPVHFIVSKVTRLGRRPISFAIGPGFFVARPEGAPQWRLRVALTLLFPR